jgi:hypothetical protein
MEHFTTCQRKWGYQYLDKIKVPQSKAAEFGLKVHEFLEKYLTGYAIKYETDEGRVASPGLCYLPKNLPKENVERPVFFIKNGLIFHGYIDFFEQVGSQTWLIGDHKTCTNFTKVLSPIELKTNIQANIYAQWGFTEKQAEMVKLRWVYYRSKGTPKALCVEAELNPKEASQNFIKIKTLAEEILTIVRKKLPSSALPKNTSACFKYGRCPFYAHCLSDKRTPTLKITREKIKESLMADSLHNGANSFHLFVDCLPIKAAQGYNRTIELSELLQPILQKIQTEKEIKHYRLAGYGQHVGLISSYLSEHLKINAFDQHTAILSSAKTPEGCDTLQTLMAQAGCVIRGF